MIPPPPSRDHRIVGYYLPDPYKRVYLRKYLIARIPHTLHPRHELQASTNNRSRRPVKELRVLNLSSSCTVLIHPLNTPPSQRISALNYLGSIDDLLWNDVALPEAKT